MFCFPCLSPPNSTTPRPPLNNHHHHRHRAFSPLFCVSSTPSSALLWPLPARGPFLYLYHTCPHPTNHPSSRTHTHPLICNVPSPPLYPLHRQRIVAKNGSGYPRPVSERRLRQRLRLQVPLRRTRVRAQRNAFRTR